MRKVVQLEFHRVGDSAVTSKWRKATWGYAASYCNVMSAKNISLSASDRTILSFRSCLSHLYGLMDALSIKLASSATCLLCDGQSKTVTGHY